jgi:hypothetical protein
VFADFLNATFDVYSKLPGRSFSGLAHPHPELRLPASAVTAPADIIVSVARQKSKPRTVLAFIVQTSN